MTSAQRVLIVEDEQHLAEGLRFNLEAEGYPAPRSSKPVSRRCTRLLDPATRFDLVVLDVMLPGIDGFAVVSELRQARQFVPVLMLTARGRPEDVLKDSRRARTTTFPSRRSWPSCWRASAACCGARPGAQRATATINTRSTARTIDFDTLELTVGERVLQLTLMEANLLRYLIAHEGKAVSRKAMLEDVWGFGKIPIHARSTTSSCGCGAISRKSPPGRSTCSRSVASGIASWPTRRSPKVPRDRRADALRGAPRPATVNRQWRGSRRHGNAGTRRRRADDR